MWNQIQVKSVLNKKKNRDPWFLDDYTVNPYSGCSFNCLYCYIRGSKYGLNMAEKTSVKANALEVLEKQLTLRAKKKQYGIVVVASATEPYLQAEKEHRITRGMLELFLKYKFPVHIITKSNLVTRDFDVLHEIDKQAIMPVGVISTRKAFITFSFSTLDDKVARIFEPGATPPSTRLATLAHAVDHGFHAGVSLMPLLPGLTDRPDTLQSMFQAFAAARAQYIFPASLTLFGTGPADSMTLMFQAIEKHFPELLRDYRALFKSGSGHSAYQQEVGTRARLIAQEFGIPTGILPGL